MPVSKRKVFDASIYACAHNEMIEESTPETVLQDVSLTKLLGVLLQLSHLSSYATEIFDGLTRSAEDINDRLHKVSFKTNEIIAGLPDIKKDIESHEMSDEMVVGDEVFLHEFSTKVREAYIPTVLMKSSNCPQISDVYSTLAAPVPNLWKLENVVPENCVQLYSHPGFFFQEWLRAEMERQQQGKLLRKKKKEEKRKEKIERRKRREEELLATATAETASPLATAEGAPVEDTPPAEGEDEAAVGDAAAAVPPPPPEPEESPKHSSMLRRMLSSKNSKGKESNQSFTDRNAPAPPGSPPASRPARKNSLVSGFSSMLMGATKDKDTKGKDVSVPVDDNEKTNTAADSFFGGDGDGCNEPLGVSVEAPAAEAVEETTFFPVATAPPKGYFRKGHVSKSRAAPTANVEVERSDVIAPSASVVLTEDEPPEEEPKEPEFDDGDDEPLPPDEEEPAFDEDNEPFDGDDEDEPSPEEDDDEPFVDDLLLPPSRRTSGAAMSTKMSAPVEAPSGDTAMMRLLGDIRGPGKLLKKAVLVEQPPPKMDLQSSLMSAIKSGSSTLKKVEPLAKKVTEEKQNEAIAAILANRHQIAGSDSESDDDSDDSNFSDSF